MYSNEIDYKKKYLKYKNKYSNLIGGNPLITYLNSNGITDLTTIMPKDIFSDNYMYINQLKKYYRLIVWNDLLSLRLNDSEYTRLIETLNTYFNKSETIRLETIRPETIRPEIIIPEIIIPEIPLPSMYDSLSDIRNSTLSKLTEKKYNIYMTHILFKKYDNIYNVFGLYYHNTFDPNERQISMIKELIIERATTTIIRKRNMGFPEDELEKYKKTIYDVNSPEFWETSRYFMVGELHFKSHENDMKIDQFNTWNLEKGSGLKMLCTSLCFFYEKFPRLQIKLTAGNVEVFNNFYKKLGFKLGNSFAVLKDIMPLIYEKCKYCSEDVKLIIKNKDEFISSSEEIKDLIN